MTHTAHEAPEALVRLKQHLGQIDDLGKAGAVLYWDMTTYMPPGGQAARGRQLAALNQLAHEKFTAAETGHLLDSLSAYAESLPHDHDDAALIRVTRRNYDRATKIPTAFVGEFSAHQATTYETWTRARPANDFGMVRDLLKKTLDYSRRIAEYYGGYEHIADPLIDEADYGMKAATIRAVFAALREQLVPLVRAITTQPPADDSVVKRFFPEAAQIAFGEAVIKDYGYDFERGRQDKTVHPYMIRMNSGDIRILTRVNEHDFVDAFFSTAHEAGHALYELGIDPAYDGTPLASGTSAGVHESQSRTWENIVGRSRAFWEHYYPVAQAYFPDALADVPLETFYRAVNKVTPSLIRVDADEVTYNLHVMLRFDLELALLEGTLEIDDLPRAWNDRYTADLGITPPDDKDGCLQDVHWYGGIIGGAFQGYTLGNLMSAQFYEAALQAHPEIPAEIGQGKFGTLHTWLKTNVYQYGSKFTADELLQRATGTGLQVAPLIRYLKAKYGDLYAL
ncbi:MAG: carboxypeptidase M32 [bacterium]|nr:carboxypeptidase M32 [bacterium]